MDQACSSTHRLSPCSPAFRHKLAIAIAADSESAAPPREMTGSPNSASRGELTVASADALPDQSTGSAAMSGGSEYLPRSPRGRSNERLRCVPEIDETLDRAGSFYKRSSNPNPNPIYNPKPSLILPNLNPNPSPHPHPSPSPSPSPSPNPNPGSRLPSRRILLQAQDERPLPRDAQQPDRGAACAAAGPWRPRHPSRGSQLQDALWNSEL